MRIGISLAIVALVSLSHASTAQADGWYFSEGFGKTQVGDQLGEHFDGTMSVRIAIGRRFSKWALEGFVINNMLEGHDGFSSGFESAIGYGLSAKYLFPVGRRVELYVRAGLHSIELDTDGFDEGGYSGRALHYGAGAQIKGKVPVLGLLFFPLLFTDIGPKMTASVWAETNHEITRLHRDGWESIDGRFKSLTFGFGVGSDF